MEVKIQWFHHFPPRTFDAPAAFGCPGDFHRAAMAILGAPVSLLAPAPLTAPASVRAGGRSSSEAGWLASVCSKEVLLGTAAAVGCRALRTRRRAVEGTAPPLRRRRRKVPLEQTLETSESAPSDMLTLNSCNCDLILDTVVEFEDLLRPNEAMALLEAARVTAEREGWGAATHKKYGTKDVRVRQVMSHRTLLIIRDAKPTGDEVQFLAIAKTGAAREGKDSPANFRQKLVDLSATAEPETCLAVLGLITINQDYFLLVVTEAVPIEVDRMKVYRVQKGRAIPLSGEANGEAADALNGVLLLLEDHFYFSQDFDVTKRLQRRGGDVSVPSMSTAEPRFLWNSFLCRPLLNQSISERWFTPVMQGFLQCQTLPGRDGAMLLMLLARRSCRHAGTRYNARGLDDDAEAANWVETEMLAKLPGEHWISLAQVRGSAPVFWEQKSSTSPVLPTRGTQLQALSFRKHQEILQEEYGQVFNVSLLSGASLKRDTEGVLIECLKEQSRLEGPVWIWDAEDCTG
eukprot:s311_g7.t1